SRVARASTAPPNARPSAAGCTRSPAGGRLKAVRASGRKRTLLERRSGWAAALDEPVFSGVSDPGIAVPRLPAGPGSDSRTRRRQDLSERGGCRTQVPTAFPLAAAAADLLQQGHRPPQVRDHDGTSHHQADAEHLVQFLVAQAFLATADQMVGDAVVAAQYQR